MDMRGQTLISCSGIDEMSFVSSFTEESNSVSSIGLDKILERKNWD